MTEKNSKPEGKSFLHKLLLSTFIVIVAVALVSIALYAYNTYFVTTEEVVIIENVFSDINGDGLDDYVRYAEVVINKGDFTVSP